MKSFKNLKEIKNRDEYVKIAEMNYFNSLLEELGQNERIVRMLPTEIINMNLENKFTDLRGLSDKDRIIIIEGQTGILRKSHMERYYSYFKDTFCDYSKEVKIIIICLSEGNNLKRFRVEENVCFKPTVIETKKIDGDKYLNILREKFKNNIELTHRECSWLVHLPLFKISISEKEFVREFCNYIKDSSIIPEEEKNRIIPAMYLNIAMYIESEYEQEKLLEAINVLKYCENGLDRKIRLAREDEAEKVTKSVTESVTKSVTKSVTESVTDKFACNLLRDKCDDEFVHRMTGLSFNRIKELRLTL